MSSLTSYAKSELDRIISTCEDKDGKEMQELINKNILEIVEVFDKQGHSGFSASYAISALEKLLNWKPLTPLTGEDDEWNDVSSNTEKKTYQNKRCSSIFKDVDKDGNVLSCRDIDGIICSDNGGVTWFTTGSFRKEVTFPYTVPVKPEKLYLKEVAGEYVVVTSEEEINTIREEYLKSKECEN